MDFPAKVLPLNSKSMSSKTFSPDCLKLGFARECEKIGAVLKEHVLKRFRKKGIVVALSGGIDRSVVGALCVKALGPKHVFGLLMPERDSSPETLALSTMLADHLKIERAH